MNQQHKDFSTLLDIMSLIETYPPFVLMLKKEDATKHTVTSESFMPDDQWMQCLIDKWKRLADKLLINTNGKASDSLFLLEQFGYRVIHGETDSEGDLSYIIQKGRIRYILV